MDFTFCQELRPPCCVVTSDSLTKPSDHRPFGTEISMEPAGPQDRRRDSPLKCATVSHMSHSQSNTDHFTPSRSNEYPGADLGGGRGGGEGVWVGLLPTICPHEIWSILQRRELFFFLVSNFQKYNRSPSYLAGGGRGRTRPNPEWSRPLFACLVCSSYAYREEVTPPHPPPPHE